MKSYLAILMVISLTIVSNIHCQSPPGYLGKKNTIGIGFGLLPVFDRINSNLERRDVNSFDGLRFPVVDKLLTIEYTRAIKRNRSLSFFYHKSSTGLSQNFVASVIGIEGIDPSQEFRFDFDAKTQITSLGIMYNYFNTDKGAIAPNGHAFHIGLKQNFFKNTLNPEDLNGAIQSYDMINVDSNFSITSFLLGWSRTFIFMDNYYVRPKGLFAINFKAGKLITDKLIDSGQDDFEYDFVDRLFGHELFQFDISAGMLF